ncbi:hypothetical protein JL720_14107 [Aureococcus anophagefferens]|nr:hypothetical protein JL720_14107 [Aureococcus anophagefferens]
MAQRFRGGGGVAGALGGLPPGAGRNPPVDPAAAFAAYNQRGGLPAVPGAAPRAANPPPRPPAEDAQAGAGAARGRRGAGGRRPRSSRRPGARRRPEYDPGPIVNRAADVLVSVRRAELELAVQRRTLVAARLSTDERRLEEFANVFKAMADRIKVLERQSEGYLELAVAAKRTAEEAANNSVAIELQENHLDGVKADVARVGQGVESSKLAERVRDEGAKTTIDGVDARVVQEVSDREKAVGEVATDVVRRWDAIHEVRVQDQQARQAEGEALRTAIALAHRQTNRAVDDLGDEVRAAKRAFEDRAKTVEKAERERIDAYQKVATKRFDELERVLSAEIAARRDGASKLAARQVAVEGARDDLLKSCSKLGARIEDVDHRVGDGLRAMQESALTTAKAVAHSPTTSTPPRTAADATATADAKHDAAAAALSAAVTVAPASPDRAEALAAEAGRFQASVDAAVAAARARSSALAAATRGARGRGRGGRRARRARRSGPRRDLLAKNAASCASVCEASSPARPTRARRASPSPGPRSRPPRTPRAAARSPTRATTACSGPSTTRGEAAQATAAEGRAARSAARAMVEAEARDRKTADADAPRPPACSSPRRRSGSRPTRRAATATRRRSRARSSKTRPPRACAWPRTCAWKPRSAAGPGSEAAARRRGYLLHRVADEAQGAKNAALARRSTRRRTGPGGASRPTAGASGPRPRTARAADALDRRDHARAALGAALDRVADGDAAARRAQLGRDVDACSRRSMSRDQGLAAALAIEKRDREVSDETIQRERLVSRAVRSTEKAADADATAAFAWRTNEENWRRRSDDAGEAAARAWRDKQERGGRGGAAASAWRTNETDLRDRAAAAEAAATLAWRTNEENWRRRSDDAGEAAARLARRGSARRTRRRRRRPPGGATRRTSGTAPPTRPRRPRRPGERTRKAGGRPATTPGSGGPGLARRAGARDGRGGDGERRVARERDGRAGPRRGRDPPADRRRGGERIHGDAALGERIDDEEEERIGADAAARAASEEAFADARARAESAAALDRAADSVADEARRDAANRGRGRGPRAARRRGRARAASDAALASEAAELQRRRTDDQAALAEAVSTLEDELEDADLRLAATARRRAARDALFATDARLGDSLDERASALAGRVDDEVRDRVAALAAHEKTDETTSALGVDVAEARTAAALTSDVEVKLLARTRAAELEEKLAEEATSRGADFQRVTEDLEAKAAALTDAVAAEAAARDSPPGGAAAVLRDDPGERGEARRPQGRAHRGARRGIGRADRGAGLRDGRGPRRFASRRPRAELSKEVGLLDATLEERCSGLDHKIDEEIRAAGASSTDALQVLKDEIATTEEVKRAELSAKLSEDLDGNYSALESKVEDADAKAKALETKLADVEHKLADEASSSAASAAARPPRRPRSRRSSRSSPTTSRSASAT